MIAVDTNILVYAYRIGFREHRHALAALRRLTDGPAAWGLPVFVIGEFIRTTTTPGVIIPPSPHEDVLANIDKLLSSPSVQLLTPGERYWRVFRDLVDRTRVIGKRVFDAQIAAVCLEHGADTLLTQDTGMRRFEGLRVQGLYG